MKRIIFCGFIGLLLCNPAQAQVSVQASVPAVGLVQQNQLWNLLLVNSSTGTYECRVQLVLRDRQSGQEIMTANSGTFMLVPGAKQLNANLLNPIQYNYLGGQGTNAIQGLLPAGTYTACYLVSSTGIKAELLAEECVPFDTEPLSPPMLLFPADSAALENSPAQFSWIPPTPAGMFNRLQYDVLITEVREGQKAEQALQENLPFYNDGNVITTSLNYPGAAQSFEKEKWYAWQVIARDDRNYAGKSEVWVFKVVTTKKPAPVNGGTYVLLQNDLKGIYAVSKKSLNIKYISPDPVHEATLVITDEAGTKMQQVIKKLNTGDNYLDIELGRSFQEGRVYRISITDQSNKTHSLRFSIPKQ